VDVLLPYRDVGATLEEAIDSMLAQRGVAVRVLAVDDGSRDDGPERVAALAARHRGVVALRAGGIGIVGALRVALSASDTEVVARMDGDDVAKPDRIAASLDRLELDAALAAVGTRVTAFPAEAVGEGLARYVAWQNALLTPEDHAREAFVESPLCHPSILLRRAALDAVGGYRDVPWPEDWDLFLRLLAAGHRLAKVPAELLHWRHRTGRLTFTDARYRENRLVEARAAFLAPRLRAEPRRLVIWGAGPTGRRLARALEWHGVRAAAFVDIDPRKVGRLARDAPILPADALLRARDFVLFAVGARGARRLVRAALNARGFTETRDFICAA
jgi:glycosyltransferase involved in cell wall biosynthesis